MLDSKFNVIMTRLNSVKCQTIFHIRVLGIARFAAEKFNGFEVTYYPVCYVSTDTRLTEYCFKIPEDYEVK